MTMFFGFMGLLIFSFMGPLLLILWCALYCLSGQFVAAPGVGQRCSCVRAHPEGTLALPATRTLTCNAVPSSPQPPASPLP